MYRNPHPGETKEKKGQEPEKPELESNLKKDIVGCGEIYGPSEVGIEAVARTAGAISGNRILRELGEGCIVSFEPEIGAILIQMPKVQGPHNQVPYGGHGDRHSNQRDQNETGTSPNNPTMRSEERRVGKECRSRWSPND